jgi:hypothetical protein
MIISTPSSTGLNLWEGNVLAGKAFGISGNIAGVAAQLTVIGLMNPPASGKTVIIKKMVIECAAAGIVPITTLVGNLGAGQSQGVNISTGALSSVARLNYVNQAGSPGGNNIQLINVVAGVDYIIDNLMYVVPAGSVVYTTSVGGNQAMVVSFNWIEF